MADKIIDGAFTSGGFDIPVKAVDNADGTFSIATASGVSGRSAQIEGKRENIATTSTGADIWEGVELEIPIPNPAGQQMAIVSTSSNDTLLGGNARQIAIEYLDVSGAEQTEFLDLNGTTQVLTVATDIAFVNDFYVTQNGDGANNNKTTADGDITLYEIGTPSLVYNIIKANGNKSLSTLRKIPTGKEYNIDAVLVSGDTKGITIKFRTNQSDTGVSTDGFLFRVPTTIGDSPATIELSTPIKISAGRILKATAFVPFGSNGGTVSYLISGRLNNIPT